MSDHKSTPPTTEATTKMQEQQSNSGSDSTNTRVPSSFRLFVLPDNNHPPATHVQSEDGSSKPLSIETEAPNEVPEKQIRFAQNQQNKMNQLNNEVLDLSSDLQKAERLQGQREQVARKQQRKIEMLELVLRKQVKDLDMAKLEQLIIQDFDKQRKKLYREIDQKTIRIANLESELADAKSHFGKTYFEEWKARNERMQSVLREARGTSLRELVVEGARLDHGKERAVPPSWS